MSGRPQVVFVPGFMQRGTAWAPVAERLGQRYPTALVDHRAFEYAGRLAEIDAAAPAGAVLCGYSLGGRLALHAALAAAERGEGIVAALSYMVAPALAEGRLVPVLERFAPAPVPVQIVHPHARLLAPKIRAFVDFAAPWLRRRLAQA